MLNLSTAYRTAKGLLLVTCPMTPKAPSPLFLTHAPDFISKGTEQKNKKMMKREHGVDIYFMLILVNFYI